MKPLLRGTGRQIFLSGPSSGRITPRRAHPEQRRGRAIQSISESGSPPPAAGTRPGPADRSNPAEPGPGGFGATAIGGAALPRDHQRHGVLFCKLPGTLLLKVVETTKDGEIAWSEEKECGFCHSCSWLATGLLFHGCNGPSVLELCVINSCLAIRLPSRHALHPFNGAVYMGGGVPFEMSIDWAVQGQGGVVEDVHE